MDAADPAAAIKKIGDELKAKFDEFGMGNVEKMGDKLEEIQKTAADGPAKLLEALQKAMQDFSGKLEDAVKDPASMAPSGGGLASCAEWYGSSVAGKLKALGEETKGMMENCTKLGTEIGEPMKKLSETLGTVMTELETSLKALSKLPAEVTKLGGEVKGPGDVAKIETGAMKKATETAGVEAILQKVVGLKDLLGPAIDVAKAAIQKLADFVGSAPDMIRSAFDVPMPLCFLTDMLLSSAPPAMTSLMEMVEKLKAIDLQPMVAMLEGVVDTIMGLDIETVKDPIAKFGEFASEKVEALEKVVSSAKAAGGASAAMGAAGGMGAVGGFGK